MGLFGGSSSSSSYQTTTNHNSQVTLDGDNGGLILSNIIGSTVTLSDHNAINNAFHLADMTVQAGLENTQKTLNAAENISGHALESVNFISSQALDHGLHVIDSSYTAINDNLTQSLLFVDDQNKPDGGLALDLIKPIIYGLTAIGLAYFVIGKK